jgi:hypothetical protein
MTTQPEALRLADALGRYYTHLTVVPDINCEAAAELRRLHAVNQELLEALLEERRVRLMGQEDDVHWESLRDMRRAAMAATDAAISKAEGQA